jgi:hypothetical protein
MEHVAKQETGRSRPRNDDLGSKFSHAATPFRRTRRRLRQVKLLSPTLSCSVLFS